MATIKITASLGVGALRDDDTVETFIKRADEAMYKAKDNGRNRVVLAR
jgi:diguanylate cyclase (GGDEF)-like protein